MKTVMKIFGVLVLLAVIAVAVLFMNLDRGIKTAVEEFGPQYTGSNVTLNSVNLSPFSGEGSLTGLVVANPPGFNAANAFILGNIFVAVDTDTLTADTIVINKIRIRAPEITYEKGKKGNNLEVIQQYVQRAVGTSANSNASESDTESSSKKLIIKELALVDMVVHYSNPLLGSRTLDLKLPDIHLEDIGQKSGGATGAEVTAQIIKAINSQVTKAIANSSAIRDMGKELLKGKEKALKDKLGGLKGLFNRDK